ncbi:unnamed protein product [Brassica rapa]|uniref:Uncharacterized protein n=1 Tax=Brassica campestris TaxID=3711 RepID=A0A8D9HQE5_BRACM|nr:unnamed protein product [Brassica rapa]
MSTTPQWVMIGGEGPEMKNIIDAVEDKYRKGTGQNPEEDIEFQVLFNDFTNNGFNTLFQALPAGRRYYTAGVPGSFFGRVLPKQSFHIGVINYAFHFTSKIPKEITDRDSPLWNRDMHCTGFDEAVKKSYLDQYSADTTNLLDARAEELVPGGLMLLLGSGLRDGVKMSETAKGMVMDFIGASLNDLAQLHIYNFILNYTPLYFAEEGELRQIIKENGKFTIEAFEDIIHPYADAMRKAFELVEVKAREEFSRIQNSKPGMQYLIVLRKN